MPARVVLIKGPLPYGTGKAWPWSPEDFETLKLKSLSEPLTVLLLYWTAEVGAGGHVIFRQDIYDRDAGVLAALNSGFSFGDREVVREP